MNPMQANPGDGAPEPQKGTADNIRALKRPDDFVYAEFTRTNNELANLHREMALKNAELAAAQTELRQLNADLEQRVAQRTEELLVALSETERANDAKTEFLRRASHELRTPMHAILGFGQLLETGAHDPEETDNIAQILQAGQHLLILIDGLIEISNAESGSMTLILEPVPVTGLLEETLSLVRSLGAQLGMEVELVLPEGCDWEVLADSQRIKQVLLSLLSNAILYNRPGGRVFLECALVAASDPPNMRFCVRDTGPGISAANLSRLFSPFDRLDAERTHNEVTGSGLGLALSRQIVQSMGGRIGVESVVNKGSRFWIELPLVQSGAPPPA